MATPALIDLSNYNTLLVQSSAGRAGTPDGNIFFDVANGLVEIITAEEAANVTYPLGHPNYSDGLPEANPLTEDLGVKFEALYAFERKERRIDETLRQYDYFFEGTFKFGGAYKMVNGRKFYDTNAGATSLTGDDRYKIRGSGWEELNAAGALGRVYYGVTSLGLILALSQPYYQLSAGGAPVNFDKDGPINEAIQVYGNAVVDVNTTTFDTRTFLSNKIRTFGQNFDEKQLGDSGVSEMGGYSTGFALGESVHLTSGAYTLADVYTTQIAPWTGMTLEELDVAQVESGFNEANGSFTWVLNNTLSGNLNQCVAYLDALAQTDDDINAHITNVTNGKRVGVWYSYDANGRIICDAPFAGEGLFLENIPVADEQNVRFYDDAGNLKTRPFSSGIQVTVGVNAVADVLAWYHAFFLNGPGAGDDFNTAGALTVVDSLAADVKGNVSTDAIAGERIDFGFSYDGDTVGGPVSTDKDVVFECEGDGGVTAAKTVFTITRTALIPVTCVPGVENNV